MNPLLSRRYNLVLHRFKSSNAHSYTVSYLINQCRLSPESAILASKWCQFETSTKPDSVLTLLNSHGLSETQITRVVKRWPRILMANTQNNLLPKIEFLYSIGISRPDLASILSLEAKVLSSSLNNRIKPNYEFLKGVLLSDDKALRVLKREPRTLFLDLSKNLARNLEELTKLGVPRNCLCLLLTNCPKVVVQKHLVFNAAVDEVKKMGFDPRKMGFVWAVIALAGKRYRFSFERNLKVYERWGWSKDDIYMAFRKHPKCLMLSEEKIQTEMDFFVNKMGLHSQSIATIPGVLLYSLEKRVKPRCSVIQFLKMKELLRKIPPLNSVLIPREDRFLEKFVTKYEEKLPQLISVYQGKIDPFDLTFLTAA
ncbi:Transcription termination factor, mitochondrial/chloroplastic [Dillenia turbinata]|uniref:Transcription termination factor, mitochondrial/chloroplastic n=1 Tax=Dillenia turbinata TaxID=194707 RepID=A0AAN8YX44_9MAGN